MKKGVSLQKFRWTIRRFARMSRMLLWCYRSVWFKNEKLFENFDSPCIYEVSLQCVFSYEPPTCTEPWMASPVLNNLSTDRWNSSCWRGCGHWRYAENKTLFQWLWWKIFQWLFWVKIFRYQLHDTLDFSNLYNHGDPAVPSRNDHYRDIKAGYVWFRLVAQMITQDINTCHFSQY